MKKIFIVFLIYGIACNNANNQNQSFLNQGEDYLYSRIKAPDGFMRITVDTGSFAFYLRNLHLKPSGNKVKLYNGKLKNRQDVHHAIIDMSVGKRDLQQCADAIMRLRAEFLFSNRRYSDIHFNFTSGHTVKFIDWANGTRPIVNGNKVTFKKKAKKDFSHKNLMNYLQTIFMYCGSYSLEKEIQPVKKVTQIQAGDVFIQGGFPGHAVIVLDVAKHIKTGEKVFFARAELYACARNSYSKKF